MTSPHHENVAELLGPAALGLLTAVEQRRLDRHLAGCADCRDELAALTGVAARLAALDPEDVRALDRPAARPRSEAVLVEVGRAAAAERRRARRVQAVLAAAASVVVLVAGVVTAAALGERDGAAVPLEAVAVSSSAGVQARADLIPHTWGVEIQLEAQGLADGRTYTVVVTNEAGSTTSAGAFLGTGSRTLRCNLNASVLRDDATSFAVLDEGGRPVLTAEL